jgi:hypothetical protein
VDATDGWAIICPAGGSIMKALIVDKFQPSGINELKSLGLEVVYNTDITADTLPALVEKEDPDFTTPTSPPIRCRRWWRRRIRMC